MAKAGGLGFVDKHIEKVVLLICLLLLIYALIQYGVSSKRTYEIANQKVPPKEVDAVLLSQAQRLDRRVEAQEAPEVPRRDDLALLKTMQTDPLPKPQPGDRKVYGVQGVSRLSFPFGLPGKRKDVESGETGEAPPLAKLIEAMPAPARPVSWAGTELIAREVSGPDGGMEAKIEEPPTWRAVSWYPALELYGAWQKLLSTTVIEPKLVTLGYETEIQIKQDDGSWKTVQDVKPVLMPIYDRTGELVQPDPLPEYTGENGDAVLGWLQLFSEGWTEYQLQPDYHAVWIRNDDDPSWEAHFPFEVLDIYPAVESEDGATQTRKKRSTRNRRDSLLTRLQKTGRKSSARSRRDVMMPEEEMYMPPEGEYPPQVLPRGRDTVSRRRTKAPAKKTSKTEEEQPVEIRPEIPEYQDQLAAGKVLFWFHVNNIQFGREYRCRFRLVFANPLLTYDKDVEEENRKDAYVPSIKTKWSEWSEPICVKREVKFFLTGAFPRGDRVTVTVFTRWMDQPLKCAISTVTAGQRIRSSKRIKVQNPITKELIKGPDGLDPEIEFDTGAVAIQLDFNQRIQTSAGPRDDVEMIYLDSEGKLQSRSLYIDKNSKTYNELDEEASEASAALEPKRTKKKTRTTTKDKKRSRSVQDPMMDPMMSPPGAEPFAPTRGRTDRTRRTRDRNR